MNAINNDAPPALDRAAVEALERLARAATPGEWQLQDGCSWRRIGTVCEDGNILRPTNHHLDGHPDLAVKREDLRYIVAARPEVVLSLIAHLRIAENNVAQAFEANGKLGASNDELRLRVHDLEKALQPFANVAEHDIGSDETDRDLFRVIKHNRAIPLTVGDFRKARAALEGSKSHA